MFTVIVSLQVRPEATERFLKTIRDNAHATLGHEPGCLRFDVHRSVEDPQHFLLYEIYRDEDAFYTGHRNAAHYPAWRSMAAEMVVPGSHVNSYFQPAFPEDLPETQELVI